jgi:hypothetical protein
MVLQFNPVNSLLDFGPLTQQVNRFGDAVNYNKRREDWNSLAGTAEGVDPAMRPMLAQAGPDKGPQMYMQARNRADDISHRNRTFDASRTDADRSFKLDQTRTGFAAAANSRAAETHQMTKAQRAAQATIPVVAAIMNDPNPETRQRNFNTFLDSHPVWRQSIPPQLQADPVMAARWIYGQAGQSPEAQGPKLTTVKPGETVLSTDRYGNTREAYKNADAGKLDATTMKEIAETDDYITQTRAALTSLNRAVTLNDQAYSGAGAQTRADIVNNTVGMIAPMPGAIATGELNNTVVAQALQSLRATFGGNPTEGERKILLDVAGSVNRPASERKIIFETAKKAAQARLFINEAKAKALRDGSYYRPGYAPPKPPPDAAPQPQAGAVDYSKMSNEEILRAIGGAP